MVFPEIYETNPSKQFLTYIWKKKQNRPQNIILFLFFPED